MSVPEEVTKNLLDEYKDTADSLLKGVPVSPEAMSRYHGMTGKLLVGVADSLWSTHDLDAKIDAKQEEKCKKCQGGGQTLKGVLIANARLIIICGTIVVSLAITFNRVAELKDLFRSTSADVVSMTGGAE